jgi:hypothetical protein
MGVADLADAMTLTCMLSPAWEASAALAVSLILVSPSCATPIVGGDNEGAADALAEAELAAETVALP